MKFLTKNSCWILAALSLFASISAKAAYENYTFTTFAGVPEAGAGARDGTGANARFGSPAGIAKDDNGNFYLADAFAHTIRKVTPDGLVSTVAGLAGSSGSADGFGAAARFDSPNGIAIDSSGNLFVADTGNHTVRKITPAGFVTTLAGAAGVSGNVNASGMAARFNSPYGIAVDSGNNVLVADTFNNLIRKIDSTGTVSTFAGTGSLGTNDSSKATSAGFTRPISVAFDSGGNIYVADTGNHTIRKISTVGAVTTIAGSARVSGSTDGTNNTARFNTPYGITVDSADNLFVADTFNHTIRKITPAGAVTTYAGFAGVLGNDENTGNDARFNFPVGIVAADTDLYIGDYSNNSVRKIASGAVVSTVAGIANIPGNVDGPTSSAHFKYPASVALATNGNMYIADLGNHTVRKISPLGQVTTIAGTAGITGTNDGLGLTASFNEPTGVAVDNNGTVYVADTVNHTIRQINSSGVVSTWVGKPGISGTNNGTGDTATFNRPFALALDRSNNVYVADAGNHAVRKITPTGNVTTLAGAIGSSGTNDGTGAAAKFSFPEGIAVDSSDNIIVADDGNHAIRKITPTGTVTTLAGGIGQTGNADGTGSGARFNFPFGVALDAAENVIVSDTGNNTIRKVTPAGSVSTLAGVAGGFGNLDGTGSDAAFNSPEGVVTDNAGNIYVSDAGNHAIRKGYPAIPDSPLIDSATNRVGVLRHLTISNLTTTSWSWSFIRYPAGSSAELSASNTSNPTFTPDVQDLYTIRFQGWDNQGRTTIRTINILADSTAPTINVTSPVANQRWSNSVFSITGTATDNIEVGSVWVNINSSAWIQATGTTNWTVSVSLVPGTNTVQAYSMDTAGNVSSTNSVKLIAIISAPLTVSISGLGTVSPDYNNSLLEIGKSFSMTASAGTGYVFSNWTDNVSVLSTQPALTFTMQSNLTLHANFVPNPFSPAVGSYAGLFYDTNGITVSNAGYFTANVTASGSFSGSLFLGKKPLSVSGQFSAGGVFSNSIVRKGLSPLSVQLQLDVASDHITGLVGDSVWTSQLNANRNVYSAANPAPQGGKRYSLVLPGSNVASAKPGGNSYGSLIVDTLGNVTFAGVLADNTKATQRSFISKQGQWPFYISLYSGQGVIIGWLSFSNQPTTDVNGTVFWIKLPQLKAKLYPGGFNFENGIQAIGSQYTFTTGVPAITLTNDGTLILEQGNLPQSITNQVSIGADSKVTSTNGVSITVTTATGLFKGSVPNPAGSKAAAVTGVVLQKQNSAYGTFFGTNQSGSVSLLPQP